MNPARDVEANPDHPTAGRSAAARGETGTATDELPPPLGQGRAPDDLGGMPRTLESSAAAGSGADSAEADLTSDVDEAAGGPAGAAAAGDAQDAEPRHEDPLEQLARPGRNGSSRA